MLEERLLKRLKWLNHNICPGNPLDFDRVAPSLMHLPGPQAMEVLKVFEENADQVRNPNSFVISKARGAAAGKALSPIGAAPPRANGPSAGGGGSARGSGGGSGGGTKRRAPSADETVRGSIAADAKVTYYGGSAAPSESEVQERIDWLNDNVPMGMPLEFEKVAPDLMSLDAAAAMGCLERIGKSTQEVRDPNAYVIFSARRIAGGGGGGTKRKRGGRNRTGGGKGGGGDDGGGSEMADEFDQLED